MVKFFVAVVKLILSREQRAGAGCINEVSAWQPAEEPPRATGMKRVERNEEEKRGVEGVR